MLRTILLITLFAFSLSGSTALAQTLDSFSNNRMTYLSEVEAFMEATGQKQLEEIFEAFSDQSSVLTDDQFTKIIALSNAMRGHKLNASTYFSPYLSSLTAMSNYVERPKVFEQWHATLSDILLNVENRKFNDFKAYLSFSKDFLSQGYLKFGGSGLSWIAESDDFEINYNGGEPTVEFKELQLIGLRKVDSISIVKTSGICNILEKKFKADGGYVNWDRSLGTDAEVSCSLGEFEVDLTKPFYAVDNAVLTYPELFPGQKLKGKFQDKITVSTSSADASYPRFVSQDSLLKVEKIGPGIVYQGGFQLTGYTVNGFGSTDVPAEITIYNQGDTPFFRGLGKSFTIRKGERISGESIACAIYFDQDSIYHPSINLKYIIPRQELNMARGKRGNDRNPFYDSYHKMNIDVNSIKCLVGKDTVIIGGKSVSFTDTNREVSFESLDYYEEGDFQRLQNISSTNPLIVIRALAEQQGTNFLHAEAVAQKFNTKFDASSIQSLIYDLVSKGFVNYDSDRKIMEVKDKVYHYTNANSQKTDYDILKIKSVTKKTNAVLNLKDKSLLSQGIGAIEFSQQQKVALKPHAGQVVMQENRNMDFDGKLFAGFTIYEGSDFHFDYDKNQIEMDSIRYFDLFVPTGAIDDNGNPIALSINSRLENANGVLLIDAPNNKSGKEDIPVFPSFQSKESSFVYYDDKSIMDGVYSRDSFYFEVDPFSFNGLDDFSKNDLNFKGTMVSADIFPNFEETLVLQEEDNSLGFVTKTPDAGYKSYQEKGLYNGEITLNRSGFFGLGSLQYLGATINSEDFVFRPRRLTASANRFDLVEDRTGEVEFPQATGLNVNIDWRPYVDSMYVRTKEDAFKIFKSDDHNLVGMLILTPGGLKGRGDFNWELGKLNSKLISFDAYAAKADTGNLQILTFGQEDIAFDTKNVNADLNFDEQLGHVKANEVGNWTTMPYNQFQTSLDEFIWDMKGATVTFQNEQKLFGNFRSIHPDQDSLNFQGKTAFYDLKTNQLQIGGVPYLKSCDAFIYLGDGNVEVKPGGDITELENCKIVADTLNKYHVINNATVKVRGRKEYQASGFYEYNVGDKQQEIAFEDVIGARVGKGKRSEKPAITRATGQVESTANFHIDDNVKFQGKITLSAEKKNLDFEGFAKFETPILPYASWFSINCEADKRNLAIPYDNPKSTEGQPLGAGIYLSKETAKIYPSFLMPLYFRKDRPILQAKGEEFGLFKHDKATNELRFGDSTTVLNPKSTGKLLTLNNQTGKFFGTGELNLGSGLKHMSAKASGTIKGIVNENTGSPSLEGTTYDMEVNAMVGLDFRIPEKLLKVIITDLQSSSFDARPIDYNKEIDFYNRALTDFIDNPKDLEAEKIEMKDYGLNIDAKNNPYEFLFSKLTLKWNEEYQSFYNHKDLSALSSISAVPINRLLKTYVELKMPTNGDDRMYIYLVSPSEDWYYFSYKGGILSTVSSSTRYNDILLSMKPKDLSFKLKDGEFYEIQPINPNTAQLFVNRIKAIKAGN